MRTTQSWSEIWISTRMAVNLDSHRSFIEGHSWPSDTTLMPALSQKWDKATVGAELPWSVPRIRKDQTSNQREHRILGTSKWEGSSLVVLGRGKRLLSS